MLRIFLLISAFLQNMMSAANERDTYMYPINPTPSITTEKPAVEPQANYLSNYQYTNLYTYTGKPVNPPIINESDTRPEQNKPYKEIPVFASKQFVNNENVVTDNSYNANTPDNYATTVPIDKKPDYNFNLPIYPEQPDNKPTNEQLFLPDNRSRQHFTLQPSKFTEKPTNEEETIPVFPFFHISNQLLHLPVTEEPEKQVVQPYNRPQLYESEIPVLTEKSVKYPMKNQGSSLPYDQPEQLSDYYTPVYTKKLLIKLSHPYNRDLHKTNLPILTEKPAYNSPKLSKDDLIKKKLVSLILSSKKDLDRHIRNIQRIHHSFKSATMYKIGYLTSLINKANESLSKLYKNVQNNHHHWDSLRVLKMYEQVKDESELVRNLLQVMLAFMKAKHKYPDHEQVLKELGERAETVGISWSYYDDTMP